MSNPFWLQNILVYLTCLKLFKTIRKHISHSQFLLHIHISAKRQKTVIGVFCLKIVFIQCRHDFVDQIYFKILETIKIILYTFTFRLNDKTIFLLQKTFEQFNHDISDWISWKLKIIRKIFRVSKIILLIVTQRHNCDVRKYSDQ